MATINQVKIVSGVNGAPIVTPIGSGFPESDGSVKSFLKYCLEQAGWTILLEDTYTVLAVNYTYNLVIRVQNNGKYHYSDVLIPNGSSYHSVAISLGAMKRDFTDYNITETLYRNKNVFFNLYNIVNSANALTFYGNENSFLLTGLSASEAEISTGMYVGELNGFDPFRRQDDQAVNEVFAIAYDSYAQAGSQHLTLVSASLQSGELTQSNHSVMTDIRGIQGWHFSAKVHAGSSNYLNTGSLVYPNMDGNLDIDRVLMCDNGQRRGYIPGMFGPIQTIPLSHGDTMSTNGQSVSRDFEYIKCNVGGFLIETSNNWNV